MTLVFDTEPLLAYVQGGAVAGRVERLLARAAAAHEDAYASRVTYAELGYVLSRRHAAIARSILDRLEEEGIRPYPCDAVWQDASALKARFARLSLADAFAAATARATAAPLVIVDDDALAEACRAEGIAVRQL